jgi:hypothetical protein
MNYGGLFTNSNTYRLSVSPALDHFWLHVDWAALNPTNGGYDFSPITSYLKANPGVNVRLHIGGGPSAPAWLLGLYGTVSVTNTRSNITQDCGRYWVRGYKTKYADFCNALGATFDSNPRVASVNMAGCSLIFEEPFILGGDAAAVSCFNGGLTATNGRDAMYAGLAALTAAFPTTVCEFAGHSARAYPNTAGTGEVSDWSTTTTVGGRAILNYMHNLYGAHYSSTDYGLGPTDYTAAATSLASAPSIYSWMHLRANLGYPIGFQLTAAGPGTSPTATDLTDAIRSGIDMKARWVEHSSYGRLTNSTVQNLDATLKANITT